MCSAGHGGQTLLSAAAHDALDLARAEGLAVRMLGRYVLAGLDDPETVYQISAADLRARFPKLRAPAFRGPKPA